MYTVLPRILCVDDEPNVLDGMARNLRRNFNVTTATSGDLALAILERDGPFAAVVSDQRMPLMDGVTLLSRVRELWPDTVRILLTGYADTPSAIAAVNRGAVFRFLSKPIEPGELTQTLQIAVEQHRLAAVEKVLLERTLYGSITAIIDVLALMNADAFGRAIRVKKIVAEVAAAIAAPNAWQIEIAAMISQVGAMAQGAVPAALPPGGISATYGRPAGAGGAAQVETATLGRLSRIAADMVANIPRMEEVHAMLTHQELRYDASNGDFGAPREQAIPLGSRILKVATDLDQLESGGMPRPAAVEALKGKWGWYDPALLEALAPAAATPMLSPMLTPMLQPTAATPDAAPAFAPAPTRDIDIEIRKLEVGMTVREDIRTAPGRMLISRGQVATAEHIRSIKGALGFNELRQLVRVTPVETAARPARRAGGMFG